LEIYGLFNWKKRSGLLKIKLDLWFSNSRWEEAKSYNFLISINRICRKKTELKRSLGLVDATSLVAGSMIVQGFL
jgi:hypothetical protein